MTDECSDSSSEEQKSQSGSDLVPDSEKTSDSGVLTNNSGGSTPVNVIPVQLSHNAPPFHMECQRPFEILHGPPILVHHHHHPADQMAAYYQPIAQYTATTAAAIDQLAPIGYQVIPEEQATDAVTTDDGDRPDGEPAAGYSAENSDSGISSPNSEVMVNKGSAVAAADNNSKHEKQSQADGDGGGNVGSDGAQTAAKKSGRNKKSKQRSADKTASGSAAKVAAAAVAKKREDSQKNSSHHEGGKKSSKIAKEPAIIKKLNAKKSKSGKCSESEKSPSPDAGKSSAAKEGRGQAKEEEDDDENQVAAEDRVSADMVQLSLNPVDADWVQEEVFCSLECTPRSTTADHVQFKFTKTQSVDSCESAEEETFATAVNCTGNSDTESEMINRQDEQATVATTTASADELELSAATPPGPGPGPGPITEAVTKWLNDQGGLMLAATSSSLDDDSTETDYADDSSSEYDDFDENPSTPKNVRGNPYPAPSRSEGSRVAGASHHDQRRKNGLLSSGVCCLTQ